MYFRVLDTAAERCVWSVPPIDTVPWKLRTRELVVRSIDSDGAVFKVATTEGPRLEDLVRQLLVDQRAARLDIHLAMDDSYAGHAVRLPGSIEVVRSSGTENDPSVGEMQEEPELIGAG